MKLNGMAGKGSGKLGSMVYATVRGAQIVRQYNPIVYNPNTEKQVVQRVRFSILSKLAATLSEGLVFQSRKAMVSNRNAFIKANFGKFNEGSTEVNFGSLEMSSGNVEAIVYPIVSVDRQTNVMTIAIESSTDLLAGFGYGVIIVTDNAEGKSWVRSGIVMSEGSTSATVTITLPSGEGYGEAYVIGYPMFFKNGATKVSYQRELYAAEIAGAVELGLLYNRMASRGDLLVYATKALPKV